MKTNFIKTGIIVLLSAVLFTACKKKLLSLAHQMQFPAQLPDCLNYHLSL